MYLAIKEFFVFWWKIINGDIDFFFSEKPFGAALACTIIDMSKSGVGRVFTGFVFCYFIAVVKIFISPITAILRMIEEKEV